MQTKRLFSLFVVLSAVAGVRAAEDAPRLQRGSRGETGRVFKAQISAHWFHNDTRFWYRNDLRGGAKEFILVDSEKGTRKPAFDHQKLAAALSKTTGKEVQSERLPFDSIEFVEDNAAIRFDVGEARWRCDLQSYELRESKTEQPAEKPAARAEAPRLNSRTGEETYVTFVNRRAGEVELFWLNTDGTRQSYGKIAAGAEHRQHTFAGHTWLATDDRGNEVARVQAETDTGRFEITRNAPEPQQQAQQRPRGQGQRRGGDDSGRSVRSPDGKWTATVKESNIFLRGDAEEFQLTKDGETNNYYGRLEWSPDSSSLVAWRIEPAERKEVYLVQSSPVGGGRAKLQTRGYALPGDKFTQSELSVFDVTSRKQTKPNVDRFEHEWLTPRVRWSKDGHHFTFQKADRGHQRFRLVEVNVKTGEVRNLIDERTDTFIWTAHTESANVAPVSWMEKSDEIIYASESNGWRHLYLIDAKEGKLKNQITKGEWIVRGIERIDEEKRQVWFRASGQNPKQDPYLIHFCRVNFDGTGLVALTDGDGNHTVQFSPDRKFIIDTYSRVDLPAVNELRRVDDGKLVCKLEEADISDLKANGWAAPEVFVTKARDGKTDIWGIITRPRDFDPNKKYPIIEDIYAGPQGSFVPKTFNAASRYRALNDLGFIVAKMDGMGTANRSKAFHDVCWKNLKDAGFEDRILWHKAVAKKYPYHDISRVGIYGTSAGGQNAAGAVLFHPEFYKAAVANCGCHDNRMDKASWNEQWMGYPVGSHYGESSNIDNAGKLQGHLMLVVGEMDSNVPPESTFRFVDALIKANKDFDFLMVPGGGHGAGGAYGQRRLQDFFVRHLMGTEPPNRNTETRRNDG